MKKIKHIIILTVFLHLLFYTGYVVAAGIHPDCCVKEMKKEISSISCCESEETESTTASTGCSTDDVLSDSSGHSLTQCDCIHLFDTDYSFLQKGTGSEAGMQLFPVPVKYEQSAHTLVKNHSGLKDYPLQSDHHSGIYLSNRTLLI